MANMKLYLKLGLILICTSPTKANIVNKVSAEFGLPNVYEIEDFNSCSRTESRYCKLKIELKPEDPSTPLWKYIKGTKNSTFKFDRSVIYRSVCIPKEKLLQQNVTRRYATNLIQSELKRSNLSGELSRINCVKTEIDFSTSDFVMLCIVGSWILIQILATIYDLLERGQKRSTDQYNVTKYVMAFSIVANWKRIILPKKSEDYNKLRCIQGIRAYNLIIIICEHIALAWIQSNLSSLDFVETMMGSRALRIFQMIFFLAVQTNFLISSLLLTNRVNEIYEICGHFSIKDALILLINRYFRLLPGVLTSVLVFKSSIFYFLSGPNNLGIVNICLQSCEKNWLETVLMISNIKYMSDMCHPGLWYLSIDTQLYAATILFLYLMFKFNWNPKKAMSLMFLGSCLIYGSIIYANNLNVLFPVGPEEVKIENFFNSVPFNLQYISFYCNWSTSIVGIIIGTIYFTRKNKPNELHWIYEKSWVTIFTVLPVLSMVFSDVDLASSPVGSAILGSLLKPMFSIGIGIGILGITFSRKGIIKAITEWKYAVMLSNFAFSTYVSHFVITNIRMYSNNSLLTIADLERAYITDLPVSFIIGAVLTVVVEQPAFNLQKIVLPQVRCSPPPPPAGNSSKNSNIKNNKVE